MRVEGFLFVLYLGTAYSQNDGDYNITVQYYEELIKNEQAKSYSSPLLQNADQYKPITTNLTDYGTFDYIIVGAGSSGAVIATRLSEEDHLKILVIEAGGPESDFSDIPGMAPYLRGSRFNWQYLSVPQKTCCLGMKNRQCPIPRGKVLGGTSVINALMYVRGNKKDYDAWQSDGNLGWSYKHVLPYFIKSENSEIDGDSGYHGKGGFLNVEYHRPYSPEFYSFIEANVELGRKIVDYNGKEQLGVAPTQLNSMHGRRASTGRAFLQRAIDRKNLKVLTHSFATKVVIDKNKNEARGVLFSYEQKSFVAWASKEVIISAGAVGSPQLLMLSGIGPTVHLKKHNISVVKNLSVGNNLQDHATFFGMRFTSNYSEPTRSLSENVEDYLHNFGPLTIAGNSQGLGFFQTNLTNNVGVPDIEVIIIPANSSSNITQHTFHYSDETYNTIYPKFDVSGIFTFYLILLHPKSRGTVQLKSSDPYDYPLINPNYLSDPKGEDIETIYGGIQLILEMINTTAFKRINATLFDATLQPCKQYDYLSKAYWYCQIRQLTMHIYHPIGTCKMGPNPARGAVVDHRLKVHGIKRLRVADASIIPFTTSGHTNAPSIMIGEKLSDMIRNKCINDCGKYQ